MRLHYTQGSPFARMVRVLVREKRLDCEEAEITVFPPPAEYFGINPLGQVPVLETPERRLFPTGIILDYLMSAFQAPWDGSRSELPLAASLVRQEHPWKDGQVLSVLLAFGDLLATMKYQEWAGLRPVGENVLGFVPAKRNGERIHKTLDWLESAATRSGFLPDCLSVQDIVLICLVQWTESRGPIEWRGRPRLEAIVALHENRASFVVTAPRPWHPKEWRAAT
jgi:glutathione S-transferase